MVHVSRSTSPMDPMIWSNSFRLRLKHHPLQVTDEQHSGFFAKHPRDSFIAQEAGEGNVMVRTRRWPRWFSWQLFIWVIVSTISKNLTRAMVFFGTWLYLHPLISIFVLNAICWYVVVWPLFYENKDTVWWKKILHHSVCLKSRK